MQITLQKLLRRRSIDDACLGLLNQLVFRPDKARSSHHGGYYAYGSKLNANLHRLRRSVRSGRHRFDPYVCKTIKTKGKARKIYLASWPDRIVERWMAEGVNHALRGWYSPNSYAYRPGKFGLDVCQAKVAKAAIGCTHVVRRDVSNYFYSIPHDQLLQLVGELVPIDDPLHRMLTDRIRFEHSEGVSDVGVPFGSPIACVLANAYLTALDKRLEKLPVAYFRYADDFLILAKDEETARIAADVLDDGMAALGLSSKPSHRQDLDLRECRKFKFLGLEFDAHGGVRLGREKQRKIVNLFKREFKLLKSKLKKMNEADRLALVIESSSAVLHNRIRSAAIVDYYLKHVNDERQLRELDMLVAKAAISAVLQKPFRYRDFGKISYKQLRKAGLPSLVHRRRLHAQGHLKVDFLSAYNDLSVQRYEEGVARRRSRIDQMAMLRKLKAGKS